MIEEGNENNNNLVEEKKESALDGSEKVDDSGSAILAYTNDDMMSLSRAWTGFDLQSRRSNIEGGNNRIDPLKIVPDWRDKFPKMETTAGKFLFNLLYSFHFHFYSCENNRPQL